MSDRSPLTPELEELIKDFVEISKAGADSAEIDDPDLGESAMIELVEFVRVGAQFLFEEFGPPAGAARTIH